MALNINGILMSPGSDIVINGVQAEAIFINGEFAFAGQVDAEAFLTKRTYMFNQQGGAWLGSGFELNDTSDPIVDIFHYMSNANYSVTDAQNGSIHYVVPNVGLYTPITGFFIWQLTLQSGKEYQVRIDGELVRLGVSPTYTVSVTRTK